MADRNPISEEAVGFDNPSGNIPRGGGEPTSLGSLYGLFPLFSDYMSNFIPMLYSRPRPGIGSLQSAPGSPAWDQAAPTLESAMSMGSDVRRPYSQTSSPTLRWYLNSLFGGAK